MSGVDIVAIIIQALLLALLHPASRYFLQILIPIEELTQSVRIEISNNIIDTKEQIESYFKELRYKRIKSNESYLLMYKSSKPTRKSKLSGLRMRIELNLSNPISNHDISTMIWGDFDYTTTAYRLNPFIDDYCILLTQRFHEHITSDSNMGSEQKLKSQEHKIRRYDLAVGVIVSLIAFPAVIISMGLFGTIFEDSNSLVLYTGLGIVGIYVPLRLSWYVANVAVRKLLGK